MKKHYKFRLVVDEDVLKKYSLPEIDLQINAYLNDPNGWGHFFEQVDAGEDVLIRISSPSTIKSVCGLPSNLSCAELGGKHMYLNSERWMHGSKKSKLSLENYRQYMVSHEIGHILGFDHKPCPCVGCKAPIMMQQTLGIGKCLPNIKVK